MWDLEAAGGQARLSLDVCNLGDSGLTVYRSGKAVFSSTPTNADPSCPHQLAVVPERYKAQGAVESDGFEDSMVGTYSLQQGDWVVIGSDGVLDNLNMQELGPSFQAISDEDPTGPVAAEVVAAALRGRKVDDITAIAMFVERCGQVLPSRL